jgi:ferredoxin-type protein NapF
VVDNATMVDLARRRWLRGTPEPVLRPPWALRPDAAFTSACTRCGDCIAACPQHIVAKGEAGFPVLDLRQRGCTFCGACVDTCRPKALDRAVVPAISAQLGIGAGCLARQRIDCRVCGDACDARALRFPPRAGGPPEPVLDPDRCTRCGQCVPVCPVQALKLIPVSG